MAAVLLWRWLTLGASWGSQGQLLPEVSGDLGGVDYWLLYFVNFGRRLVVNCAIIILKTGTVNLAN
jgi:hypothetical protein